MLEYTQALNAKQISDLGRQGMNKSAALKAKNVIQKLRSKEEKWTNKSYYGEKPEAKILEEQFKKFLQE